MSGPHPSSGIMNAPSYPSMLKCQTPGTSDTIWVLCEHDYNKSLPVHNGRSRHFGAGLAGNLAPEQVSDARIRATHAGRVCSPVEPT